MIVYCRIRVKLIHNVRDMIAIFQIIINFETSRIMQSLHMLRRIATLLLRVWRVIMLCIEIIEIMEKLDIKIINYIRSRIST